MKNIIESFENGEVVLGVIVACFSVLKAVNYIGVTDLEIQIMTKYQKLKNSLLIAMLIAIIFTFIFYFTKNITELFISFIAMYILVILALLLVWVINLLFAVKPKFEIKINNEVGPWHLRRLISDEKALLVHSEHKNKYLISNLDNAVFMRSSIEETYRIRILYKKEMLTIKIVILVLFYLFSTGMIYQFLFYWSEKDIDGNKPIGILFPFIGLIFIILSHVFYFINKKYYNDYLEYRESIK
ncbi:hypothetical protein CSV67_02795 [Sporosarcina sp. P2]|uniref:hypothetical protein n=1 Tax=Sporosarcina sp. P2 TaxID=2048251 RepID=UPI000C16C138|nr:hypothetical protein [Sporosarcina sp. P2]PID03587.1 hypothetical protein CSV67_02795 [Sporosarcina sp. P2]